MGNALWAALVTLFSGAMGTLLGGAIRFRELGPIAAAAVMGGFIIYYNEIKK